MAQLYGEWKGNHLYYFTSCINTNHTGIENNKTKCPSTPPSITVTPSPPRVCLGCAPSRLSQSPAGETASLGDTPGLAAGSLLALPYRKNMKHSTGPHNPDRWYWIIHTRVSSRLAVSTPLCDRTGSTSAAMSLIPRECILIQMYMCTVLSVDC